MLYNIHRDPKKGKPLNAQDFMVTGKAKPKPRQTAEQMEQILKGWAVIANARANRQGN